MLIYNAKRMREIAHKDPSYLVEAHEAASLAADHVTKMKETYTTYIKLTEEIPVDEKYLNRFGSIYRCRHKADWLGDPKEKMKVM